MKWWAGLLCPWTCSQGSVSTMRCVNHSIPMKKMPVVSQKCAESCANKGRGKKVCLCKAWEVELRMRSTQSAASMRTNGTNAKKYYQMPRFENMKCDKKIHLLAHPSLLPLKHPNAQQFNVFFCEKMSWKMPFTLVFCRKKWQDKDRMPHRMRLKPWMAHTACKVRCLHAQSGEIDGIPLKRLPFSPTT